MALKFPPIYLLKTRFENDLDALVDLGNKIGVVYSIDEAEIVLTKGNSWRRANLDLSALGITTDRILRGDRTSHDGKVPRQEDPSPKRRKIEYEKSTAGSNVTPESGIDKDNHQDSKQKLQSTDGSSQRLPDSRSLVESQEDIFRNDTIKVLKLAWYTDSVNAGILLPIDKYVVYEGKPISPSEAPVLDSKATRLTRSSDILSRATADAPRSSQFSYQKRRVGEHSSQSSHQMTRPTKLVHQTTSEHAAKLPPIPGYLHTNYSCQRPTPLHTQNDSFICELKKIRTARLLHNDEIGVRAYSSSIASIAAYPYTLTSAQEILALPKCDQKIATIYQQWKETGHIPEVDEIEADPEIKTMKVFYDIWGVGAVTAREFYNRGWRDLDDVLVQGWESLSRVQQIGLKFYDEFQEKIPRDEVEKIGETILQHANKIRQGYQMIIVGGYRRGKPSSGDVDVVLSHPDEEATDRFVEELEASLVADEWITHTLTLSNRNSERGQVPVSWKGGISKSGSGFDTLDKALVVWQDPSWPSKEEDLRKNPNAKNPNVHRRVDIIISPWKTAGCAVIGQDPFIYFNLSELIMLTPRFEGWSGGTTFERDLRQYCKKEKNLKFDSSGVRSREDGAWVDLEQGPGDMLVKERRVFAGLGLEWREPTDRCTT
jgi:DNA polymerase IV